MAYHTWGDDWFEKNGDDLHNAIRYCMDFWRRWGRIGSRGKEKWGCYDKKTKLLTSNGWKLFKNINIDNDMFATINSNGEIEYHKAYDYIEYEYTGLMYKLKSRGVDLLVTPNHNLYCARGNQVGGINNKKFKKYPLKHQTYHELFQKPKRFLKGGIWKGEDASFFILPKYTKIDIIGRKIERKERYFKMETWLSFLGWVVAEGCIGDYRLDICLSNINGEKEVVKQLILELGYSFSESYRKNLYSGQDTGIVLHIFDKQLCSWLHHNVKRLAPKKRVPKFIKNLTPKLIQIFLKSLYSGDGHKAKTSFILYTVSKKLMLDVMELLLKAGSCGSASFTEPRAPKSLRWNIKGNFKCYAINWLMNSNEHHTINSHDSLEVINKKESLVNYSGMVYCITVPNNTLYVMRNGKATWCGNSFRDYPTFWDGGLYTLLYPGYVWVKHPFLHYKIDWKILTPLTTWTGIHRLGLWYQYQVYNYAIQKMCKKYPNIVDELVGCLDGRELVKPGIFGKVDGRKYLPKKGVK